MNFKINRDRTFKLNNAPLPTEGRIIYWMSREQRIDDNWALLHSIELTKGHRGCEIVFVLSPEFTGFTARGFDFCIRGLEETEERAAELGIGFRVVSGGEPFIILSEYAERVEAAAVVCDFNPLRESLVQHMKLAEKLSIPVVEVDSRNIVPCRSISIKQEYSAFTLRRKIEPVLPMYLTLFPSVEELTGLPGFVLKNTSEKIDWNEIKKNFLPNDEIVPVKNPVPGRRQGEELLTEFIEHRLESYAAERNDPNIDAQSGLSPYLHFGQISAQTVAMRAAKVLFGVPLKNGFLDELVVRRELSDNFCLHNPFYDSFEGFPSWAKHSLRVHSLDKREFLYDTKQLEGCSTHDSLWNAAQSQLIVEGKIHGYMRMYWAKKILEWSPSPAAAMHRAVFFNDKYSLDGHDSNGYAGCAWAIGGLHDRAWRERTVYGKVRYMNEKGCRRKFDVETYTAKYIKMH
ncbi:MAG: deoxyribodipyrimidine photo-lyase [Spirochaetales bacterium]|nr:deoxyribodipyrimidine photo-lyase [Spirochaetales bacterium]